MPSIEGTAVEDKKSPYLGSLGSNDLAPFTDEEKLTLIQPDGINLAEKVQKLPGYQADLAANSLFAKNVLEQLKGLQCDFVPQFIKSGPKFESPVIIVGVTHSAKIRLADSAGFYDNYPVEDDFTGRNFELSFANLFTARAANADRVYTFPLEVLVVSKDQPRK